MYEDEKCVYISVGAYYIGCVGRGGVPLPRRYKEVYLLDGGSGAEYNGYILGGRLCLKN